MKTIRFSGRRPSPEQITIGMETDSNAETLRFLLPEIAEGQIATLQMILPDGTADALEIAEGQTLIPARIMEIAGTARAWVEILADNVMAWHSALIYMGIGGLPEISDRTEQQYPTAFQDAIAATLGNRQAAEAAQAAAEIAAAIAQSAQGNITTSINTDGDLIITYTDTAGTKTHVNLGPVSAYAVAKAHGFDGTEAEWEQYIANASIKAQEAAGSAAAAAASETAAASAKLAAQEAAATAAAAYGTDMLADDYDPDTGATAGKYYIHAGAWYLCLEDTTGEWDGTKFSKKQVGGEVSELKSAIERLLSALDSGNVPAARAILGAAILGLSQLG